MAKYNMKMELNFQSAFILLFKTYLFIILKTPKTMLSKECTRNLLLTYNNHRKLYRNPIIHMKNMIFSAI